MDNSSRGDTKRTVDARDQIGPRLLRARIRLALSHPFFATALMRLPLREISDATWCPTMATDGYHVFFNAEWTARLTDSEIRGVLAHEVLHVVLNHIDRQKARRADLWNLAADYAINLLLCQQGFRVPAGGAIERHYEGMSAEEIYEKLLKQEKLIGHAQRGASIASGDANDTDSIIPLAGPDLIDPSDPRVQAHHSAQTPDREQLAELRAELQHDMHAKLAGRAAAQFKIECLAAGESNIDWRSVMRSWLFDRVKVDWSSIPFSKKYVHRGLYFPSLGVASVGQIVFAIDTSGSMTGDELGEIISEIRAFRETFPCRLTVLQADAAITDCKEYEEMDGTDVPNRMPIKGRGGTSFLPVFDWMRQASIPYSVVLIYATDGYGTFPEAKPGYPVLWLATKRAIEFSRFPFGIVVRMKNG